eukprot:SAG31_NODE_7783_length_1597_cov_1.449266_1_plen_96_part_01
MHKPSPDNASASGIVTGLTIGLSGCAFGAAAAHCLRIQGSAAKSEVAPSDTMEAVVIDQHGGPEQLVLRRVPRPNPATDEILIQQEICGVNFIDTH